MDDTAAVQRLARVTTVLAAVATALALVSVVALVFLAKAVDEQTCVAKTAAAIDWTNSFGESNRRSTEGTTVYQASPAELRKLFDVC